MAADLANWPDLLQKVMELLEPAETGSHVLGDGVLVAHRLGCEHRLAPVLLVTCRAKVRNYTKPLEQQWPHSVTKERVKQKA